MYSNGAAPELRGSLAIMPVVEGLARFHQLEDFRRAQGADTAKRDRDN
jgi:hypothetical protein